MPPSRRLNPNSVWDRQALTEAFEEAGIKSGEHVKRVHSALLRDPDVAWSDIPDLPKAARAVLEQRFARLTSRVLRVQRSAGGDTTKLLLQLQDGMQIEAVVMNYDTTERYASSTTTTSGSSACDGGGGGGSGAGRAPESARGSEASSSHRAGTSGGGGGGGGGGGWGNKRGTLCVSSQVGCQMGCTFCATGTMGLKGNLTAGEIVEQLVHATRETPVRNVVFMGMGEPLSNYEAVRSAVSMMTDPRLFGLSRRHVTVSTVGVANRIRDMAVDMPGVSLALSLHAPDQELRRRIVPSARAYPLDRLMEAVAFYQARSGQRVFVEYVMLAGVNDGDERAHALGRLLSGRDVHVNLIPWNPVLAGEGIDYAAPAPGSVDAFRRALRGHGLSCTVRQEKGQDISGACGQLVIDEQQQRAAERLLRELRVKEGGAGGGSCGGSAAAAGGAGGGGMRDIEDIAAAVVPSA